MTDPRGEYSDEGTGRPRVVVRDKRRIDPVTGEVRNPAPAAGSPAGAEPPAAGGPVQVDEGGIGGLPTVAAAAQAGAGDPVTAGAGELAALQSQLDERTSDLQRIQAEYANYRRRVDRDRHAVVTGAKAQVAGELLTVLDDVERAAAHGDLAGPFKSVAEKMVAALQGQGLEPFGAVGDEFDPSVHEAVQHDTSPAVSGPTVTAVLRRGYRFGERVLRAAMVAVTDAEPGAVAAPEPGLVGEPQDPQG